MFNCEASFFDYRKKQGQRKAVELISDINEYTRLLSIKDKPRKGNTESDPNLTYARTLLDYNEHFIELSNMGEETRSLSFMLVGLMIITLGIGLAGTVFIFIVAPVSSLNWYLISFILLVGWPLPIASSYLLLPTHIRRAYFTALRARYRFNRTTRKVYVVRPARYGGNVVLDWDRVLAHVHWCAPRMMEHEDLADPAARQARQDNGGGFFSIRGLLLYWPPLDKDDPERKGEDVLWVGPKLAGEELWQYIRTYMEEGMAAVPEPNEFEWLRKGFHSISEHIKETELGPSLALDHVTGRAGTGAISAQTGTTFLLTALWAPLHCLAERLCYWPTFPEEWNSDCGQKRRESGIGPEEPLHWQARP